MDPSISFRFKVRDNLGSWNTWPLQMTGRYPQLSKANNSMKTILNISTLLLVTVSVLVTGCGESIPDLVPVTAFVKSADGEPIGQLKIRLVPQDNSLDGNYIASGITGDDGKCVLKLPGRQESEIPACQHKVLILEAPESAEARQAYMSGDPSAVKKELSERKGRPIPDKYSTLQRTPLVIEISAERPEIEIVLE